MRALLNAWRRQPEYAELLSALKLRTPAQFSGLPPLPRATLAAALFADSDRTLLLLTASEEEAAALTDNLRPLVGEAVQHFPVLELLPFEVYAHNIELIAARVRVLSRLCRGERLLVVACVNAISRRLAPADVFRQQHLRLRVGEVLPPQELARRLSEMGFERVSLTEIPGTFSLRGSIADVFPIDQERPLRLEYFDDEIESLRYFDPAEQRSQGDAEELLLAPARELPWSAPVRQRAAASLAAEYEQVRAALHGPAKKELEKSYQPLLSYLEEGIWDSGMESLMRFFYPQAGSLLEYLDPADLVLISEPEYVKKESVELAMERESRYYDLLDSGRLLPSFYFNFLTYEELCKSFASHPLLMLCQLSRTTGDVEAGLDRHFLARDLTAYAQNPTAFSDDLKRFIKAGWDTVLTASSQVRLQRMEEILRENGAPPARLLLAGFTAGFESPQLKLAVITENELFARQSKKRRRVVKGGEKISHFIDLRPGDFVVHISQGIGQYLGVERLSVGETERDYLLIRYAGEDKLYLPVDQLDLIQKYVGNEGAAPKLYRLGGGDWNRVKAKVRAAVADMAEELLALYAEREKTRGYAFAPDSPWQKEFEDAFPFAETQDQLAATEEIKADMESERVMDRLLCGDVGYGKTEVALRAAFKAVMDGKQAAFLVPTTVLAQQHFRTISERFSGFPVTVGSLSRFSSPKEQKEILTKLRGGGLDIVVGTHRLLSADVEFKDLGLLVVDEEQRFGVAHKEKIKGLKKQVDVLTLSATPIPRTLHMSLVGMRDMSLISTPPEARRPVQTYVVEYHQRLIRDAIARELGRGGQVFYLHNRVFNIQEEAEELQRLLPQARIAIGHGQMRERELEQVMLDFVAGEADVLVCTTIIESGLDIPNVNTLIVNEADMFGLAQLYQLRGRVGRSERQAFAYFTYRRERIINEIAKKRLIAIRDFTELGAGFKIAMRDLELRGAGNLLGPEQHGHIAAVGFDLYCKLLAEEMKKAKGEGAAAPEVATQLELDVNAFLPDSFVDDSVLKVEIYQRLAAARSFDEIDNLCAELVDRYGPLPRPADNLMQLCRVKLLSRRLAISSILQKPGLLAIRFADHHGLRGEHLLGLVTKWEKRILFSDKKGFVMNVSCSDIKDERGRIDLLLRILSELDAAVRGAQPRQ